MKRSMLILLVACSTAPRVPQPRFANAPPVAIVNDRRDVPTKPSDRLFLDDVYHFDGLIQRRWTRGMELHPPSRALGVNADDEVPDSTWFTNRIGARDMSVEEVLTGPNRLETPEHHKPWTVKSTKIGGAELGFVVVDARGDKFLLKFDSPGVPEQETGAHAIVQKILWACGYNTPEDYLVHFRSDDLVLAPDAYIRDSEVDSPRPLTREELEHRLARTEPDSHGGYRAIASHWLPGKPLGGHPAEGVREDDPNDRIAHERRRDLRGLYAIAAWLDHTDIQEGNFLDMWAADPADPHRHYVKHYMIDFGKSLGVMATTADDPRRGYEYWIDWGQMGRSLFSAGAYERAWERRTTPRLRGVGLFDARTFAPGHWRPSSAGYVPFTTVDRYDAFWAAKILIRFTREQLHAIVDSAQYTDPRAAEYLTDTLVARQRASAAYWFDRVNPLDRFSVEHGTVCFDDLALRYGITSESTAYQVTTFDRDGKQLATGRVRTGFAGHTCTTSLTVAGGNDRDAYTIVELQTLRTKFAGRTMVHLARDHASNELRVIGIWRP